MLRLTTSLIHARENPFRTNAMFLVHTRLVSRFVPTLSAANLFHQPFLFGVEQRSETPSISVNLVRYCLPQSSIYFSLSHSTIPSTRQEHDACHSCRGLAA